MVTTDAPRPTVPAFAGEADAGDIAQRVERAQVALLLERTRSSNLVGIPVGLLMCWLLWDILPRSTLLAWLAMKLVVTAVRLVIAARYRRDGPAREVRWGRAYEVAVAVDGVIYGLIGTWLLPMHLPEAAAMMVATVIGIAAVGLIVLSSRFVACMAFCIPVLLPAILWQLVQGTHLSHYAAMAMAVFLALIVVEGRRASETTRRMLSLRFETAILAAQRQQALDLAQRHSAVKSRFLATMSHEMRTPLHGMLGLAALARAGGSEAEGYLGMLDHTGRHLLGLINDVLDYSKIESGHLKLVSAPFDLAELLEGVAGLTRVSAAEKGLGFELDGAPPKPSWVLGDGARLRQVLLNLTGNAIKFTDQGQVQLQVRRAAAGRVEFEVIDSGEGVPDAERERIFEAFEQADSSFGRRHGGTGLGLAISRELARAMGGDVACLAAPPGAGARFRLQLPLPQADAPAVAPAPPPMEGVAGAVLLVEDNPVNALVAEAMLRRAGLRVDAVHDGAQAVARLAERRYDLVLMDCQMPGMDGFEATRRVRLAEAQAGRARQRIVALTANALEGDRQRSLEAGMDDHLAKPFGEPELAELLRRHLAVG